MLRGRHAAKHGPRKIVWSELYLDRAEQIMPQFDRITVDPNVMGGRLCIRGLRITTATVVGWIAGGATCQDILADYPCLEEEDIRQALACAKYSGPAVDRGSASVRKHRPNQQRTLRILRAMQPQQKLAQVFELNAAHAQIVPYRITPPISRPERRRASEGVSANARAMSQQELLTQVIATLQKLGIEFMLSGSYASSLQGEARATHDIDLVASLSLADAPADRRLPSGSFLLE